MEPLNLKTRNQVKDTQPDQLLADRYAQLVTWARGLARGDEGKAEELVQEFCLYVTLAKPDLRQVENVDGYLYTCLRHTYLSNLARASREALHLVNVEDYDSFALAVMAPYSGDALQRQNDLRRICAYTVWRKESSKSASYFILHFFHGYGRREIGEIARVPTSAIYNKLKLARGEVVTYLQGSNKLRLMDRSSPPSPSLAWKLSSTSDLFQDLRRKILEARFSDCLPEDQLLRLYDSSSRQPVPCSQLAHIVSCERCLSLIDHNSKRPTLKDREPLDSFGYSSRGNGEATPSFEAVMQSVRQKCARVREHRPKKISIALNGMVIASHDVRSERNRLSVRIEDSENAQFVEVFSEQHVRLAMLAVGEPPPEGLATHVQRISLSDERWLELTLRFEGLGLFSEVVYQDPALAVLVADEDGDELSLVSPLSGEQPSRWMAAWERQVRAWVLIAASPAIAWVVALVIVGSISYFAYQSAPASQNADNVLNHAIQIQSELLQGNTEHQSIQIQEIGSDNTIVDGGSIDLWQDGNNNRLVRRLYDARHDLIAAQWKKSKDGRLQSRARSRTSDSVIDRYWDQDLSAKSFASLEDGVPSVRSVDGGFELTRVGPTPSHPELISVTLVLDRHLQSASQILRVRRGSSIHEVRFAQTALERQPSRSVPDTIFDPEAEFVSRRSQGLQKGPNSIGQNGVQTTELQIETLYQLSSLKADTGVPIEVVRTPDGRVRVSGTLPDNSFKQAIDARLRDLPNHQLLDLRLVSSREYNPGAASLSRPPHIDAYEVSQPGFAADAHIRGLLQSKGLSGERLDAAVVQFSRESLQHAQHALQHAYALDRLGGSFSVGELRSISPLTQRHWVEMVNTHSTALESELRSLQANLVEISFADAHPPALSETVGSIDDPAQFARSASVLLRDVQELNRRAGEFFASGGKSLDQANLAPSLQTMVDTIPLQQAAQVAEFAERMANSSDGGKALAQTR